MFWGISLEVGKKYSQTVEKSFHISMAAVKPMNQGKGPVTVMVEVDKACYPLCTLQPSNIPQQALDYKFTEGEEVLFYTEGDLDVHLTGYLIDEPSMFEYNSEGDDSDVSKTSAVCSDNENNVKKKKKRKKSGSSEDSLKDLISEIAGLNEEIKNPVDFWLEQSGEGKKRKVNPKKTSDEPVANKLGVLLDTLDVEESSDDADWVPGCKLKKQENTKKRQTTNTSMIDESNDNTTSSANLSSSKSERGKLKQKKAKKSKVNARKSVSSSNNVNL